MSIYPITAEKVVIRTKADTGFIIAIVLLWGIGLVTLYIASGGYGNRMFNSSLYFVKRHIIHSMAGCVFLLILCLTNMDFFRKFLPLIVFGGLVLCVLTQIPSIGVEKNGARRWIEFGPVSFQPSEFVKLIIPLFLANLLAKKHERINSWYDSIAPSSLFLFGYVILIFLQDDFSTAVFVLLLGLFMFFIAGVNFKWFLALFFVLVPLLFIFIFVSPYRIMRMVSFLTPGSDPHGAGYQVMKAQAAISAGGFWGQDSGLPERFFSKIPEVQADFVFTGWAEEMGLFGVLIYFVVLIYFAVRGLKIALECRDRFRSLLAFGATAAVIIQSLLNCGVVSGVFPPTGIPLPFFSAGGTSLLVTMGLCGMILNVSRWNSSVENVHE